LLIAPPIDDFLRGGHGRKVRTDYYANVRAFLGRFVAGAIMVNGEDIKRLNPPNKAVWEIRIRHNPHSRLLGGFLDQDCFVALRARFRDLVDREYKGRKGFDAAIEKVEEDWINLFGIGIQRSDCYPLSRCITGAIDNVL
jgi:hypothetical protein